MVLPPLAQAQFTYTTNSDNTITITKYTGSGGDVVFPGIIDGRLVTGIGEQVFYRSFFDYTCATSVTIPDSVTNIGHRAFGSCPNLSAITVDALNPTYASVDGVLFSKSQTTLVQFPAGKPVTSYTIPESVTSIGDDAMEGCVGLTSITIPNSVTGIGNYAFSACTHLASITIPESVTGIGTNAFYWCSSLNAITIPHSIANIGDNVFSYCFRLASITIPNSVTNIGTQTFQSCSSLTSVTIPGNVACIGDYTFEECTGLTNVMLGKGITSIGNLTFDYCLSLTYVSIPSSMTHIGVGPFARCPGMIGINVDTFNPSYSSVDGVLFDKKLTMLVQYPGAKTGSYTIPDSVAGISDYTFTGCTNLTNVTIPNGVPSIGTSTFDTCSSLTSIQIPSSVTNIGNSAFLNCFSLTNVTIPYRTSAIGDDAFADCTNLVSVHFMGNAPSLGGQYVFASDYQTTAYYLPGTTGWGPTFGDIPTAQWTLPYPLILRSNLGIQSNQFGFTVSWATNLSVVMEAASTDSANPKWAPVTTNALSQGTFYFADPEWTKYPSRFYRVRSQ